VEQQTGLQNNPVGQIIERFWGDLKRWPAEPDGRNFTQSQITAVAEHISKTGDCLWHAESILMGWPVCHCADCNGPTKQ